MTETLNNHDNPEEKVFGSNFTFAGGVIDEEAHKLFLENREAQKKTGALTWIPGKIGNFERIYIYLYKNNHVAALIKVNPKFQDSIVYHSTTEGPGCELLSDTVKFPEAVELAEEFASNIPQEDLLLD